MSIIAEVEKNHAYRIEKISLCHNPTDEISLLHSKCLQMCVVHLNKFSFNNYKRNIHHDSRILTHENLQLLFTW